ncbi:MAG TPA: hypothetical protein VF230_04085, partial [Acidimicrobiales bacterium]
TDVAVAVAHPVVWPLAPHFVVAVTRPTVHIQPGSAGTTLVRVTSNGAWLASPVSVSVTGAPAGSAATLSPASGTLAVDATWASTLTVTRGQGQTGDFQLTVTACGLGICHDVPAFVVLQPDT